MRADRKESGQVIVETAVGLSLLAFVWVAAAIVTFMSNSHVRCAMAARHAAWLMGNKGNPSAAMIETNFFMDNASGLAQVRRIEANGVGSLLSGSSESREYSGSGNGPYKMQVIFGLQEGQETESEPLALMKVRFPFMPATAMEELMQVKSHCQWDETGDSWTSLSGALQSMWKDLEEAVEGFWVPW
jgi:hypothetical protein